MTNSQQILDGLLERRSSLENERPRIEAEFERINQKKTDLEQRLSAIDIVIKEFGGSIASISFAQGNGQPSVISEQSNKNSSDVKTDAEFTHTPNEGVKTTILKRERRGMKTTAREFFGELPNEYTKNHVAKILIREHTELKGKVNENTLRGVVMQFIESGAARIKTPASGTSPQIYEKV